MSIMEINKEQKKLLWVAGIILALVVMAPYIGLIPKFEISDSNFFLTGNYSFYPNDTLYNYIISYPTIRMGQFSFLHGNSSYVDIPSGKVYYLVDGLDNTHPFYESVPDLNGTHIIYKVQIYVDNDKFNVLISTLTYLNQVETITLNLTSSQICKSLAGTYSNITCSCPNGDKWTDNSTAKVCGPITEIQNQTVTNTITVQPSFQEKYGISLITIAIAIVVIYLVIMYMGRKK